MTQYTVKYTRIPTNYNDSHTAIVEANTPEDARELVKRQLGDIGVRNYVIQPAQEYKPEPINGRIISM